MVIIMGGVSGVSAMPMLSAQSVSTNMGQNFAVTNIINQTGLSSGYTSGVTDFDAYIAGIPTHTSQMGTDWVSAGNTTGYVDFDFGSVATIESIAIWNVSLTNPNRLNTGVSRLGIYSSSTTDFTTSTFLGEFAISQPTANPTTAQVLSLSTAATGQYLRFDILSNYGSSTWTALGEVAFETAGNAVPEPTTILLLGAGLLGLVGFRRKLQK